MGDKILLSEYGHGEIIVGTIAVTVVVMCICVIIISLIIDRKVNKMNMYHYYQEELFNSLGTNIDDVFIIFDAINKRYEYISPNFERSIGLSTATLINDYEEILQQLPTESRNQIHTIITEQNINRMSEVEFEFINPVSGNRQWILIRVYPVFVNPKKSRFVTCIRDTTKEKTAQKTLEDALEKLRVANEAEKNFLSHISHELKTPINAIIGMTQIAANSLEDRDKIDRCLQRIGYASDKLLAMINNILDYSKIDNSKLCLENNPFSIHELLRGYLQLAEMQAELNNQYFTYDLSQILNDCLIGDELRFLQIISNCISNAIKFTPSGGKISFQAIEILQTAENTSFTFVIKDTGKGMSPEYLERIFIPFEQEDLKIFKKYGGTGLGMSIAHSLIHLMGGTIQIESTPNVGTSIEINLTFPICKDRSLLTKADHDVRLSSSVDYSSKRVLVVEDNEINQEITREFLKHIKINVETASDGYEAIKMFNTSNPGYYDIILMDLIMPGLNGYDTTKAIRSLTHPDANKVCIIAMTADNFAEHIKSIEAGMNYHMTKPFDLKKFYDIINQVLKSCTTTDEADASC